MADFFFKMAAVFFEMYKMSVLGIKECINWYPIKKRQKAICKNEFGVVIVKKEKTHLNTY